MHEEVLSVEPKKKLQKPTRAEKELQILRLQQDLNKLRAELTEEDVG